jgi:hypothetical protein
MSFILQIFRAFDIYKQIAICTEYRVTVRRVYAACTKCGSYCLIALDGISMFQDVWTQKILITVLCYNNFSVQSNPVITTSV